MSDFLTFDKKQASYISAGLLLIIICSFILGYITGQKKAISGLNEDVQQTAFDDQVKYSLYSSYRSLPERSEFNDETPASENSGESVQPVIKNEVLDVKEKTEATKPVENSADAESEFNSESKLSNVSYMAQLFGCGSMATAKKFVDRLKKIGVETEIKRRSGKNNKGKSVTWYQVVTKIYSNKSDLMSVLEKIQVVEKLQKVRILEV